MLVIRNYRDLVISIIRFHIIIQKNNKFINLYKNIYVMKTIFINNDKKRTDSQMKYSMYTVNTPVYQGPLDLLLNLIEKAELDISKLSLAKITDEYLNYVNTSAFISAEEITLFLIIATRLIQIKSELLLPNIDESNPDDQDEGDLLIQQLIVYRKFKNIAKKLEEIEAFQFHTYLRLAPVPIFTPKPDMDDISLDQLVKIFGQILYNLPDSKTLKDRISIPRVTLKNKLKFIANRLSLQKKIYFHELLDKKTNRIDIIITFLAVLELIKQRIIEVQQKDLFSEIEIERISEISDVDGLNLEFDN